MQNVMKMQNIKREEEILWHVAVKYIKPKGNRIYMCAHFVNKLTNDYEWFMSCNAMHKIFR